MQQMWCLGYFHHTFVCSMLTVIWAMLIWVLRIARHLHGKSMPHATNYIVANVCWNHVFETMCLGIPLPESRKVTNKHISCFLIEMKFISKILWILLMDNLSFSDPHLHIFKNNYSKIFIKTISQQHGVYAFHKLKKSKIKILIFTKIIFSQDVPRFVLC